MTDATDQRAFTLHRQCFERSIARFAICTGHANFNQLVIMQRPLRLGDDRRAHAGVADEDDRFERMGEPTQVPALFFC